MAHHAATMHSRSVDVFGDKCRFEPLFTSHAADVRPAAGGKLALFMGCDAELAATICSGDNIKMAYVGMLYGSIMPGRWLSAAVVRIAHGSVDAFKRCRLLRGTSDNIRWLCDWCASAGICDTTADRLFGPALFAEIQMPGRDLELMPMLTQKALDLCHRESVAVAYASLRWTHAEAEELVKVIGNQCACAIGMIPIRGPPSSYLRYCVVLSTDAATFSVRRVALRRMGIVADFAAYMPALASQLNAADYHMLCGGIHDANAVEWRPDEGHLVY